MTKHEQDLASAAAKCMGWTRSGAHWLDFHPSTIRTLDAPLAVSKYHPWFNDAVSLKQADELMHKLIGLGYDIWFQDLRTCYIERHEAEKWPDIEADCICGEGKWWPEALCEAVLAMEVD